MISDYKFARKQKKKEAKRKELILESQGAKKEPKFWTPEVGILEFLLVTCGMNEESISGMSPVLYLLSIRTALLVLLLILLNPVLIPHSGTGNGNTGNEQQHGHGHKVLHHSGKDVL
jgi:hypothetical protein